MLVSIITPSYNAEKYIAKTIESVLKQTYTHWEMLISDDCSIDKTREIILSYVAKDKRIKLIPLSSKHGPGPARNVSIAAAKGDYIAFLDADDLWVPEKLEKQIQFMQKNHLAFSYASYFLIDEDGYQIGHFSTKSKISYASMLKTCSVGCLTAMYDVSKLGKIYMKDIPKGQDYVLWLEIMKNINQTQGILEPLGYYRILSRSVSSNKLNAAKAQWKIYRDIEEIGLVKSCYYLMHYTYHGIMKYRK